MIIIKYEGEDCFSGLFFFCVFLLCFVVVDSLGWCEKLAVVVISQFKPLNIEHWTRWKIPTIYSIELQVIWTHYVHIFNRESEDGNREALFKKINFEFENPFHVSCNNDDDDKFRNDKSFKLCSEKLFILSKRKRSIRNLDVLKTFILPNFIEIFFSSKYSHFSHSHDWTK